MNDENTASTASATPWEKAEKVTKRHLGIGVYRLLLVVLLAGLYFSDRRYVTLEKYSLDAVSRQVQEKEQSENTDRKIDSMSKDIQEINITLKIMARQDDTLKDHEARLRSLERK